MQSIDYITIDIEGLDEKVIQDFDFSKVQPKVISIEDHKLDIDSNLNTPIKNYLNKMGYCLHSKMCCTSIYVK